MILFRSTNEKSQPISLREAFMHGLAPDGGLYFPEKFPKLTYDEIAEFRDLQYHEIAVRVLSKYLAGIIPEYDLAALCRDAYNFEVPLELVYDRVHVMRLDCGPTASFKDFAARM